MPQFGPASQALQRLYATTFPEPRAGTVTRQKETTAENALAVAEQGQDEYDTMPHSHQRTRKKVGSNTDA